LVGGILASLCPLEPSAASLNGNSARAHVQDTIDLILQLIVKSLPYEATAAKLRGILTTMTALSQLARFAAGRYWRAMTEAQQAAFVDAFSDYIARVYAGYFRRFDGSVDDLRAFVRVNDAIDAGIKGFLVGTEIIVPHAPPISVSWLVSDRSGKIAIADVVVEGISLAATQREEIGAMLERYGGDLEAVIAELRVLRLEKH